MANLNLPSAKRVLAFNASRVLIGVFRSVRSAAEMTQGQAQSISKAAIGKANTTMGYYWRHEHDDVEVEMSDVGTLSIEEYDDLCGVTRKYLNSRNIKGKRTLGVKNTRN